MFNKYQTVFLRCFVFWMMSGIVMVAVDIQIKIGVCCDRLMRQRHTLSENLDRHFICHEIPSMREVPAKTFAVMVATDKPAFTRADNHESLVPLFIPVDAEIPEVNQYILRLYHIAYMLQDCLFKAFRTLAVVLHFVVVEVGVCQNPVIQIAPPRDNKRMQKDSASLRF